MSNSTTTPDAGQSVDGLYEVVTTPIESISDIPFGVPPQDRESKVAELVADVDQHLITAWQHLFFATRDGVTIAEAAEALQLPIEFLDALRSHALRRMADQIWFSVHNKRAAIAEYEQEIDQLTGFITDVLDGDEETVRAVIRGAY